MEVLSEVLERDRANVDAHRGMAEVHALRDSFLEAIDWSRKVVLLEPGNADWRAQLVLLLLRHGDLNSALAHAEEALRMHPVHPVLLFLRGEIAERKGALDEAVYWIQMSSAADPTAAYSGLRLGSLLLQLGDLTAAAEQFGRVLTHDPANPPALAGLRDVHPRAGRRATAAAPPAIG